MLSGFIINIVSLHVYLWTFEAFSPGADANLCANVTVASKRQVFGEAP